MRVYFDKDDVLHIEPQTSVECMALKYWSLEYREHGSRVLAVDTKPPAEVPATA